MIFVTLGTQDKTFPRLLEAVDKLNTKEQIIIQAGSTKYEFDPAKKNIQFHDYLNDSEFDDYMKQSDIIICHAGVGTIIKGLKLHKKLIVAARLKKYKEHVNDHQLQILEAFSQDGYIIPLHDFDNLQKLLTIDFTPRGFVPHKREFNALLDSEINKLTKTKKFKK